MKLRIVLFSFVFAFTVFAQSGETTIGNGGDVVVCFNIPLEEAIEKRIDGSIGVTERGWLTLKEGYPVTLDYFEAQMFSRVDDTELLKPSKDMDTEAMIKELNEIFSAIPGFYQEMNDAYKIFMNRGSWREAPWGLIDWGDSNEVYRLPPNCASIQAIIFYEGNVYYDKQVITHLSQYQYALLFLHEELYYIGKYSHNHPNSAKTRDLIVDTLSVKALFSHALTQEDQEKGVQIFLQGSLAKNGFGKYQTKLEIEEERRQKTTRLKELESQVNNTVQFLENEKYKEYLELRSELATQEEVSEVQEAIQKYFRLCLEEAKVQSKTEYARKELEEIRQRYQEIFELYKKQEISIDGFCLHTLSETTVIEVVMLADQSLSRKRKKWFGIF